MHTCCFRGYQTRSPYHPLSSQQDPPPQGTPQLPAPPQGTLQLQTQVVG